MDVDLKELHDLTDRVHALVHQLAAKAGIPLHDDGTLTVAEAPEVACRTGRCGMIVPIDLWWQENVSPNVGYHWQLWGNCPDCHAAMRLDTLGQNLVEYAISNGILPPSKEGVNGPNR